MVCTFLWPPTSTYLWASGDHQTCMCPHCTWWILWVIILDLYFKHQGHTERRQTNYTWFFLLAILFSYHLTGIAHRSILL
jgi:hypothetical protein